MANTKEEPIELTLRRVDFITQHLGDILREEMKHEGEKGYVQVWVKEDFTLMWLEWVKADQRTLRHFRFFGEQPTQGKMLYFQLMWSDNHRLHQLKTTLITGEIRPHPSGLYELEQSDGKTGMFTGFPFTTSDEK